MKSKRESSGGSGVLILAAVGLFLYAQSGKALKPVAPDPPSPQPAVVDARYTELATPIVTALAANPAKRQVLSGFFTDYARVLAADGSVLATTEQFRRVNSAAINVRVALSPEAAGPPSVGLQLDQFFAAVLGDPQPNDDKFPNRALTDGDRTSLIAAMRSLGEVLK